MQLTSIIAALALSVTVTESFPIQQIDSYKPYSQSSLDQFNILRLLGTNTPYVQNPGYGIQREPPYQCHITQANLLSRHGERYPKAKEVKEMNENFAKFQNGSSEIKGPLSFLKDYEFKGFDADDDSLETSKGPYAGLLDLFTHGTTFRARYDDLYQEGSDITFWTSSSKRVSSSAKAFAKGFMGDDYDKSYVKEIDEDDESLGANSLTPWCDTIDEDANDELVESLSTNYLNKTASRLNDENEGLDIDADTVSSLFKYCGYELQVDGTSAICDIFNDDELVSYSYAQDVQTYYWEGPGANFTKMLGSIYIDAVVELLKDDSKNLTLSFTHSEYIFYAATVLGIFDDGKDLPVDHQSFNHLWKTSNITPMGARLIFERLQCDGEDEPFVRIVHNDAVIPIAGYSTGPGFSTSVSDFEKFINERVDGERYSDECASASTAAQNLTIYWE